MEFAAPRGNARQPVCQFADERLLHGGFRVDTLLEAPARMLEIADQPVEVAEVRVRRNVARIDRQDAVEFLDLPFGGSPLGLWAMALTVVAYVTLRVRDRADDGPVVIGFGLFTLTVLGHGLFALAGTLFGQQTLANSDVTHLMLLPALYTTILGAAVLPLVTLAVRGRRTRGWAT